MALDGSGRRSARHTTFTTFVPAHRFIGFYTPENRTTVGTGIIVSLDFNRRIVDRAAVERAVTVNAEPAVEIAPHWFGRGRLDFRPRERWRPGTQVTLDLRLRDVKAGPGIYGTQRKTIRFRIGRDQVSIIDAAKHRMTVRRSGRVLATLPITAGNAENPTYNGKMVILERHSVTRMDGDTVGFGAEYDIPDVPHAMRLTRSGTFLHGNYWARPQVFGGANTSHGCVGLRDVKGGGPHTPAGWLFAHSRVGDTVEVRNSRDHRRSEQRPRWLEHALGEWKRGRTRCAEPMVDEHPPPWTVGATPSRHPAHLGRNGDMREQFTVTAVWLSNGKRAAVRIRARGTCGPCEGKRGQSWMCSRIRGCRRAGGGDTGAEARSRCCSGACCSRSPRAGVTTPTAGPAGKAGGDKAASQAAVTIAPKDGAEDVATSGALKVTAQKGKLKSVKVKDAKGNEVGGKISGGGALWQPSGHLGASTKYIVDAIAVDGRGRESAEHSTFTTLVPKNTFIGQYTPENGQQVGVGMPVSIRFTRGITDPQAVEDAIKVTAKPSVPVEGRWFGNDRLDFRPEKYWAAGTKVTLTLNLDGVEGRPGVYGTQAKEISFTVGRSQVSTVDA